MRIFWLCLCLSLTPAATAQLFADDAAREQAVKNKEQLDNLAAVVRDLNKKIIALEKDSANYKNILNQVSNLSQQQQKIAAEVRDLRGQIEENTHFVGRADKEIEQLQAAKTQTAALSKSGEELSRQLAELTERVLELQEYATVPEESELYNDAFAQFQKREYSAALSGFKRVLKFYPDGKFQANAGYWVSNAYLALEEYSAAAAAAEALIEKHAGGDKVPDAMLILARAQGALGRKEQMKSTLRQIINDYPTSFAGDKARQLLAQ